MAKLLSGTTVYGNATVNANLTVGGTTTVNQLYNGGTGVFQANGNTSIAGTTTSQTIYLQGGNNLMLQSANLASTQWSLNSVTVTGSQSDPFGGTNAFLLNDGTSASGHSIQYYNFTTAPAGNITYSVYAKAGTSNFLGIYLTGGGSTTYGGIFFNLTTGAYVANLFGAPLSYGSAYVSNGWWRLWVTIPSSGGFTFQGLYMLESGTNYNYTGTNQTVNVFGPQIELGTIPSPYTPTTTTAITQTNNLYIPNGNIIGSPTVTGNLSVTGNLIITGTTISNTTINTTDAIITTNTVVTPSITIGSSGSAITVTDVYDLDDISYATDGFTNVFPLTYNQNQQTFPSPFNLMVTINGLIQPAFYSKYDTVWLSNILPASKGYTLDISGNPTTNNYIKFADCPPPNSQVDIRTVVGSTPTTPKTYPFKPLDIFMGY